METKIKSPKKKRVKPVAPPMETTTKANLDKPNRGSTTQLKLNVDPEIKKQFKSYSAEHETSMSDLFVKMFEFYRESH